MPQAISRTPTEQTHNSFLLQLTHSRREGTALHDDLECKQIILKKMQLECTLVGLDPNTILILYDPIATNHRCFKKTCTISHQVLVHLQTPALQRPFSLSDHREEMGGIQQSSELNQTYTNSTREQHSLHSVDHSGTTCCSLQLHGTTTLMYLDVPIMFLYRIATFQYRLMIARQ